MVLGSSAVDDGVLISTLFCGTGTFITAERAVQSSTAKHYPEVSAPAGPNTSVLETSDSAAKVAKLKWAVGK